MEINLQKLQAGVAAGIGVAIVAYSLYLGYSVFFSGPVAESSPTLASVSPSSFSGANKIKKSAEMVGGTGKKISFTRKDYLFTESSVYKSFTDDPVVVPLSDTRGRPDPFVPYAAP